MQSRHYACVGTTQIYVEEWSHSFHVVLLMLESDYPFEERVVGCFKDRNKAIEFGVRLSQMDEAELLLVSYLTYE